MKLLLIFLLSAGYILAMESTNEQDVISFIVDWNQTLQKFSDPEFVSEFKEKIQNASLWDIVEQEKQFIKTQEDFNRLPLDNFPLQVRKIFINTKAWSKNVLVIMQDAKKSKIITYMLHAGFLVGACICCCTFYAWYKHKKEKEKRSNIKTAKKFL